MRSGSICAAALKQASSQVLTARCSGLVSTAANVNPSSRCLSPAACASPCAVSGMSVSPVCWRDTVQAVSPCLARYTIGSASLIWFTPVLLAESSLRGDPATHVSGAVHEAHSALFEQREKMYGHPIDERDALEIEDNS